MKIYIDIETKEELAQYLIKNSWSGAKDRVKSLSYEELKEKCEELLNYEYEELSETQLNDIVWFDDLFNEEEDEENEE